MTLALIWIRCQSAKQIEPAAAVKSGSAHGHRRPAQCLRVAKCLKGTSSSGRVRCCRFCHFIQTCQTAQLISSRVVCRYILVVQPAHFSARRWRALHVHAHSSISLASNRNFINHSSG
ncbi:hypothetical protein C8Q80DRAFT_1181759 [Daedaleopsis nitida]|nr:hypothetical protein C8Q80DRAFT_1181759 [Daedaleopsis nitida]